MELANRIRKIRKTIGITQSEVAYKIDITPQAYGKIERNASNAKFVTLLKISQAFEIPITFLIDLKNDNYTYKKNNL
jgi:transcriptional regulator with XRE-family HTH domain